MKRFSVILLVDPQGRILLQERDEHAPISPDTWGMVGGHVEDGEEFEPAAYRELEEETGIRLAARRAAAVARRAVRVRRSGRAEPVHALGRADHAHRRRHRRGGGPADRLRASPKPSAGSRCSESAAHFLPAFLASPDYADLTREAAG